MVLINILRLQYRFRLPHIRRFNAEFTLLFQIVVFCTHGVKVSHDLCYE